MPARTPLSQVPAVQVTNHLSYGIGDGEHVTVTVRSPVNGIVAGSHITQLSAGGGHMLALRSDGTVLGWGFNGLGELGNGGLSASLRAGPGHRPDRSDAGIRGMAVQPGGPRGAVPRGVVALWGSLSRRCSQPAGRARMRACKRGLAISAAARRASRALARSPDSAWYTSAQARNSGRSRRAACS
jgi:hypothetical protein